MKSKNTKYKYYEYIDGKLILTNFNENEDLKNLELNFLTDFNILKKENKTKVWTISNKQTGKIYKILLRPIKNSGINNNHDKRILLSKSDYFNKDINVITYYTSSPSKFCFISSSNNEIYNNDNLKINNKINSSIWYSFDCIYEALSTNADIYELKNKKNSENYYLYYSTDILRMINRNSEDFQEHNSNISVKNIFEATEVEEDEIINLFQNVIQEQKYKLDNEDLNEYYKNDDKSIGIIAEKIFNFYLNNNIELLSSYFNIEIKKFKWVNSEKESFLPYDFILNDDIYIDVKGSTKKQPYFKFSGNELDFRKSIQKDKYYIFSIFNISEENNYLFKVFSSDELDKKDFLVNTTYIYDERENNE